MPRVEFTALMLVGCAPQVNLAKLDACARMEGKKREKMPKNVTSVQAVYLLSARAKLQDANWDPGLKTKARDNGLCWDACC